MMKAYLLVANWLFSLLLLTYNGDNLIVTFSVMLYFAASCMLVNRYKQEVFDFVDKMDKKFERFVSRK